MHYVTALKQEVIDAGIKHVNLIDRLRAFKAHLASDKFTGTALDGSRLDWISTTDVANMIDVLISDS